MLQYIENLWDERTDTEDPMLYDYLYKISGKDESIETEYRFVVALKKRATGRNLPEG